MRNIRKFLSIIPIVLLTSTSANAAEKQISLMDVYASNEGMIECINYNEEQDNCQFISTRSFFDTGVKTRNTFLINLEPKTTVTITFTLINEDGAGCTDYSDLKIEVEGTDDEELIKSISDALIRSSAGKNAACTIFLENEDGTYTARTFDKEVKDVPIQKDMHISFFKKPKELRLDVQ